MASLWSGSRSGSPIWHIHQLHIHRFALEINSLLLKVDNTFFILFLLLYKITCTGNLWDAICYLWLRVRDTRSHETQLLLKRYSWSGLSSIRLRKLNTSPAANPLWCWTINSRTIDATLDGIASGYLDIFLVCASSRYASNNNTIWIVPAALALFVIFFIIVYYFLLFWLHASFGASWKINRWRYMYLYLLDKVSRFVCRCCVQCVCLLPAIKWHYEIPLLGARPAPTAPFALVWLSEWLFFFFFCDACRHKETTLCPPICKYVSKVLTISLTISPTHHIHLPLRTWPAGPAFTFWFTLFFIEMVEGKCVI